MTINSDQELLSMLDSIMSSDTQSTKQNNSRLNEVLTIIECLSATELEILSKRIEQLLVNEKRNKHAAIKKFQSDTYL